MRNNIFMLAMGVAPLALACPAIRPPSSTTSSSVIETSTSQIAVASSVAPTPEEQVAFATTSSSTVTTESPIPVVTSSSTVPVENPAPAASTTLATVVVATTTSNAELTKPTTSVDTSASVSGESTFYGGNVAGGMCSFSTYTLPSGLFGTAFSGSAWDSAAHCGSCVEVTGPTGNTITAMIVDQCPECDETHLDLFQNAFAELGDISAGIISTSYSFVSCGITSPFVLHNKSGTSAYWFSMQVVNANEPVAKLEVSTDGGATWQATTRAEYNFFENSSGFGTSSVDVRVTSTGGKVITVSDVTVESDSQITAGSNF